MFPAYPRRRSESGRGTRRAQRLRGIANRVCVAGHELVAEPARDGQVTVRGSLHVHQVRHPDHVLARSGPGPGPVLATFGRRPAWPVGCTGRSHARLVQGSRCGVGYRLGGLRRTGRGAARVPGRPAGRRPRDRQHGGHRGRARCRWAGWRHLYRRSAVPPRPVGPVGATPPTPVSRAALRCATPQRASSPCRITIRRARSIRTALQ